MARKSSTHLYDLVKSLSPSEKRYFRLFTSLHTVGDENKYMRLFDALEQAELFDEDAILILLEEKKGVTYSKLKKYLYNLILKALRNFHSEKNGTHQLTSCLDYIGILFSKGLFVQAKRELDRADDILKTYDLVSYSFMLANWRKRLEFHQESRPSDNAYQLNTIIEAFGELNEYMSGFKMLQEFTKTTSAICSIDELPELVRVLFHKEIDNNSSLKSTFFKARIQSIVFRLTRENDAYLEAAREAYKIASTNSAFENEDVLIYTLEPLIELSNALLNNRLYADFKKYIKKCTPYIIASKTTINNEGKANIDAYVNLMMSEYERRNGRKSHYEDYQNTIRVIESDPILHPSSSLKNLYYWEQINWHFTMGKFDLSVNTVDRMVKDIPDFQTIQAAKAARWISLFELKAYDKLKRDINENVPKSELERSLAEALTKIMDSDSIGKWMNLKKKFQQLQSIDKERIHFKFFDFMDWINARLLGEDLHSPVKKQLHYHHH